MPGPYSKRTTVGPSPGLTRAFNLAPVSVTSELKVALTEVDVRTQTQPDAVNVPVNPLASYAQESYWSRTLQACLAVRACISFTPWGFGDAFSWIPGFFKNPQEGAALLYDEQLNPKSQYFVLQQDLALAAGAPRR